MWLQSQTKVWAYTQGTVATAFAAFDGLSHTLNDPHFTNILSNLHTPRWVYISLAVMAFVTWFAHGREGDA